MSQPFHDEKTSYQAHPGLIEWQAHLDDDGGWHYIAVFASEEYARDSLERTLDKGWPRDALTVKVAPDYIYSKRLD